MSPEIKTSTFVMVIAYWFDHVYKKLLNSTKQCICSKVVQQSDKWKIGARPTLERVLDVFSNNGQCTLIEPLRVMTVIHCQSGEQFNQV